MGAGTLLYNHLSKVANLENLPICCEVNTKPINQISLNFHSKNKYIEVGERDFDDHSVVYLKKK
jgi:predicted GNAT superfamily acetyltransferase